MGRMISQAVVVSLLAMATASAQTQDERQEALRQQAQHLQQVLALKESRYQIGQMERVLEGAVEHGATVMRDRLQGLMPADMLLADNSRARGFRLEGYGVFFDVEVPSLEGALPWSYQTLDQNNLGIESALRTLRAFIEGAAANDVNLQQAMKRVELQVAPVGTSLVSASTAAPSARGAGGVAGDQLGPDDSLLKNPDQAYRATISGALVDAMLEHSRGLNIGPAEWLTVAARSGDGRPRLAPADPEGQTVLIRLRGSDLMAFLGGQMSRDEALKRMDIRVF
jgi:hypothetical protein